MRAATRLLAIPVVAGILVASACAADDAGAGDDGDAGAASTETQSEPTPTPTPTPVWRDDSDDPRCDVASAMSGVGGISTAYATPVVASPSGLADVPAGDWSDVQDEAEFDLTQWVVGWTASEDEAIGAEQLEEVALVINERNEGEEDPECTVIDLTGAAVSDPDHQADPAAYGGGPWEAYGYRLSEEVPEYHPFYASVPTALVFADPVRPGEYVSAEILDPTNTAERGVWTAGLLQASGLLP
ncbi:hypothetical protein ACEK07_03865 [Alcanivoracaceae bacterium MT1]